MSPDSQPQVFWDELNALREQSLLPDSSEIARLARKSGIPISEALFQIRRHSAFRDLGSNEIADALGALIKTVCGANGSKGVVEYTVAPSLLTGSLLEIENAEALTYVVPHPQIAEPLAVLLEGNSASLFQKISDINPGSKFDAVVCQPPIGQRSTDKNTDGFGGEVVRELIPFLADCGTLYWVTGRGVTFNRRSKNTLADLKREGFNVAAVIDVAPGGFTGSMIESSVIALRRGAQMKFVGALRDLETAIPMASAFLDGPTKKGGLSWRWLDLDDDRTFTDFEQAQLLQRLTPKGRHVPKALGSLLINDRVQKADKPAQEEDEGAAFLFVPEYAGSRVTADLQEQSVNHSAVYRLLVDPTKANTRFLAQLMNSPFGKHLRESVAQGATIQRTPATVLLSLELPIPDLETQEQIARIGGDIGILQAAFSGMQDTIDQDWTTLTDFSGKLDELKGVLDIERRIADWWCELPYPLATIYRRYQVSTDSKDRLDALLNFFEMTAIYLATIGTSHVKALRPDWQESLAKWLHPVGAAGIERADFGFWIGLAGASLKDMSRISSDKDLRAKAMEYAGLELVQVSESIGPLGKATMVLDVARRYRNTWKGHGGHMKDSDAARINDELQQTIRDLYEITASSFRRFLLVRPGKADVADSGMTYEIDKLIGSDPTFIKDQVEIDRPAKTNALAFWLTGSRAMCHALPFFRLGVPLEPQETVFYVFNRVEGSEFRWISYQEAREQDFTAPDDELLTLISLD